jgi:hypothetical protein
MNGIRCPQCRAVSQLSAVECRQCGLPFRNIPQSAYVSVPIEETFGANATTMIPEDNEIGRKTFFWYRVYCAVLAVIYLLLTGVGALMAYYQPSTSQQSAQESMILGVVYAVLGIVFFGVFAVALLLPRKPFNWIVGIVMMAIGMTSCCFAPFLIPLFIYWLKPETKAYFGRK